MKRCQPDEALHRLQIVLIPSEKKKLFKETAVFIKSYNSKLHNIFLILFNQ